MATETRYGSTHTIFGTTRTRYGAETVTISGNHVSDDSFDGTNFNALRKAYTPPLTDNANYADDVPLFIPTSGRTVKVFRIGTRAQYASGAANLFGCIYHITGTGAAAIPTTKVGSTNTDSTALPAAYAEILMEFDPPLEFVADGGIYAAAINNDSATNNYRIVQNASLYADVASSTSRLGIDSAILENTWSASGSSSEFPVIWWEWEYVSGGIALTSDLTFDLTSDLTGDLTG